MTARRLRVLQVEDSADDAELLVRALKNGGYAPDCSRVEDEAALRAALVDDEEYDLVLTDHALPGFDSTVVLGVLAELAPELPCLLVSGKVGEEAVGTAMRLGAVDYVAKDALGSLPAAVERTLAARARRRESSAAEKSLEQSGQLFEAIFVNARDAMLIVDDERRLVDVNPAAAELVAMTRDELMKLKIDDLMPEAWLVLAPGVWEEFQAAGQRRGEVDILGADGMTVATEYAAAANFLPGRHIMVMRDIRERRTAEAETTRHIARQEVIAEFGQLALREDSFDLLLEAAVEHVEATLGVEGVYILELRAGEEDLVIRAGGAGLGRNATHVARGSRAGSHARYVMQTGEPVLVEDFEHETRFEADTYLNDRGIRSALSVAIPGQLHAFGVLGIASSAPRAFKTESVSFLTAIATILAETVKRARGEEEMRELALHDSLTGLPNRTLFFDRLTVALARTKRQGGCLAILFLDVDHFKAFNDTLGHRAADRLLTQIGARIERTMRETDTVARFGGDEFIVLCEDLAGEEQVRALTERLQSALEQPFRFDDEQHQLSASIGVALSDDENLDGEALLRDADIAMYMSKDLGRGVATVATKEIRDAVIDRVHSKRALEKAIGADELVLHYQPIVALADGELCAVEALVRWQHPERGLLPPGEFIPLAEETGLIVRIGDWVLRAAARQAAQWRAEFGDQAPLPVHVNFSARQVAQVDLPELVATILDEAGVPPSDIALEITETALIEGLQGPTAALDELKRMGVTVVLDDFGTGYSSLSYLERFPIDTLKIDRAFVAQIASPETPAPIVSAIIGMARALAVGTTAEGVETAEQAAAVAALGCKRAQGYFFARPAPAEQITRLVRDDTPLRERAAQGIALAPSDLVHTGPYPGVDALRIENGVVGYRESFLTALLAVDSRASEEVVHSALADRIGPATIDAQIIGPAMIEIGRLWEQGEVSVAQEHLATGIASQAAALAARAAGSPDDCITAPMQGQVVLLANVAGEEHVLGLRMAADVLQSLGADVRYLGSSISSDELCGAAAQAQPAVIGLSLTLPALAPQLEQQVNALRELCPDARLLLGGQGVEPALAQRVGATFVRDVEGLVEMANGGALQVPALTPA